MMGILENVKSFITHSDYMMFLLQIWKFKDLTPVCCILMRYRNLQYLNMLNKLEIKGLHQSQNSYI